MIIIAREDEIYRLGRKVLDDANAVLCVRKDGTVVVMKDRQHSIYELERTLQDKVEEILTRDEVLKVILG